MNQKMNANVALVYVNRCILDSMTELKKYAEGVQIEPVHTIEWNGDRMMMAAYSCSVGKNIKELIEDGLSKDLEDFSFVTKSLFNKMITMARFPKFSSSISANIMHQIELAEVAKMYDQISQILSEKN